MSNCWIGIEYTMHGSTSSTNAKFSHGIKFRPWWPKLINQAEDYSTTNSTRLIKLWKHEEQGHEYLS